MSSLFDLSKPLLSSSWLQIKLPPLSRFKNPIGEYMYMYVHMYVHMYIFSIYLNHH
jgi:hypothetical protein